MSACGVGQQRIEQVAGMGLIPHSRDVASYARMFGTEPEIASESPAWVIQLSGRVDYAGYWADNPVCVFVDGKASTYAPEAYGDREGHFNPNPSRAPDPPLALPPLAP
jgi:hypothetical protein